MKIAVNACTCSIVMQLSQRNISIPVIYFMKWICHHLVFLGIMLFKLIHFPSFKMYILSLYCLATETKGR